MVNYKMTDTSFAGIDFSNYSITLPKEDIIVNNIINTAVNTFGKEKIEDSHTRDRKKIENEIKSLRSQLNKLKNHTNITNKKIIEMNKKRSEKRNVIKTRIDELILEMESLEIENEGHKKREENAVPITLSESANT